VTAVSASVTVDAPVDAAWAAVTDWERQGDWMPLTSVQQLDESRSVAAAGLGTTLSARTGAGPFAVTDRMVVDVWEPPYRCEVEHLGHVVTGRGVFLIDRVDDRRSRVTWREEPAGGRVARLAWWASAPATRLVLQVALRRLQRSLERSA